MQHDLRGRARVLPSIVMVERQAQMALQGSETVSAISLQLRPSHTSRAHAVSPVPCRFRTADGCTGRADGAAIETRVLKDAKAAESPVQRGKHLLESGRP